MTVETLPVTNRDRLEGPIPGMELRQYGAHFEPRQAILVVGGGENTKHMGKALREVDEISSYSVHVSEVKEPLIPVEPEQLHRVDTSEGKTSLDGLIKSGEVRVAYGSLVPSMHLAFLEKYLQHVGEGLIDFVVIAKPAVQNLEELRAVNEAVRKAEAQLRLRYGDDYDFKENPILFVHEHYAEKGAWRSVRENLGEATKHLGRLRNVTINIEEAQTAKGEGREAAFAGGAIEDLGPHLISVALDIESSINGSKLYKINNSDIETWVKRVNHDGSGMSAETGVIIRGQTEILDLSDIQEDGRPKRHKVNFVWRGGKGLINRKEAVLEFERIDPETGKLKSEKITVNFSGNTLEVPESVRHLFPQTKFDDNGYGDVVKNGFSSGNPEEHFQSWPAAQKVTKLAHHFARQGQGDLAIHPQGVSLESLQEVYWKDLGLLAIGAA
jgi:predicted dehydrogenase